MSADGPSTPNFDPMLAHRLAQSQGQGGNGTIYILGGISGNVDCFKGFSPQGNGIALFNPPKPLLASQGRERLPDKFMGALRKAAEQLAEINKSTPITLGGGVQPPDNFVGSGLGGGFASAHTGPSHNDHGHGHG